METESFSNDGLKNDLKNTPAAETPDGGAPAVPPAPPLERNKALLISAAALFSAVAYTVCFTGAQIYPSLSFTVFCCAAVAVFRLVTQKLGVVRNPRGFWWALPVIGLSLFNAVYMRSAFSYFNVIAVHALFAVMAVKVTSDEELDLADFFAASLGCVFNNVLNASAVFGACAEKKGGGKSAVKVLLTCFLSLPLLLIVAVLLASADRVFDYYAETAFDALFSGAVVPRAVTVLAAVIYVTGYFYNLTREKKPLGLKLGFKGDKVVLCTFLTLLNLLFAAFCAIQLLFLFSGGFMELPEGIVYSEYAREGFFQLLFVTVINFSAIVLLAEFFGAALQYKSVRLLLLCLCAFTGILIYSSFYRMSLYMTAYNYTELRLMVTTFLAMESVLIAVTAVYLIKRGFGFKALSGGFQLIRAYAYIGLFFFIIANFTCTYHFADSLNIRAYREDIAEGTERIALDCDNFSIDGAVLLIDVYNDPATAPEIKTGIENRLFQLYGAYVADMPAETVDAWQNFSYYKNKGCKAVAEFFKP